MFVTSAPIRRLALIPLVLVLMAGASLAQPKAPAIPLKIEVKPTVLFVQEGGVLKQRIELVIESAAAQPAASVQVKGLGKALIFDIDGLSAGRNEVSVNIPEVRAAAKTTFTVTAGKAKAAKDIALAPQRKWTFYLLPHCHTDIGYTELQSRVAKNHLDYLDSVIEFCKATEAIPRRPGSAGTSRSPGRCRTIIKHPPGSQGPRAPRPAPLRPRRALRAGTSPALRRLRPRGARPPACDPGRAQPDLRLPAPGGDEQRRQRATAGPSRSS